MTPAPSPAPGPAGPLRIGSLCTGYGGLDMAVTAVLDAEVAWYAENDQHAAAVLAARWPGLRNLGDITALEWAQVPPVDLVSAGWPCQDISYAGPGPASRREPAVDYGTVSLTAFASYDPHTSSWKTSPRSARGASAKSSLTWPKSGMTRSGHAYALPMPGPATAATGCSSSPPGPAPQPGLRLLPTPAAGCFNNREAMASWLARRDRQKKPGRNGNGIGTPLAIAIRLLPTPMASDSAAERGPQLGGQRPSGAKRQVGLPEVIACHLAALPPGHSTGAREQLLPTPDTGTSPNGHGRRGGRPGNGHQSGHSLDAAARALTTATAWGEYEPAIRRWERILGHPAPPPAEPGPGGRTRLSAAFAEWMMGIPGRVTGVPGLPRTARLRIIGNGVVPHQAAAALRLLAGLAAAVPGTPPGDATGSRAAA